MAEWQLRITGIPGLDGDYPLELTSFKNKDWRLIKRVSGVRPLEFQEALQAGDNDVLISITMIALERAGKLYQEEWLWEADSGGISIVQVETEDDADPPALETSPATSAESAPSGQDSSDAGESSPQTSMENGSGTPDWVISATSGQVISPS